VLVDPSSSFTAAPKFAASYDLVRSFTKRLKPGEVWNFKDVTHCGAGLNLEELLAQYNVSTSGSIGYEMTIELKGVKCQGIYGKNTNTHVIGTSPCYAQIELIKGHHSISNNTTTSGYSSSSSSGGLDSSKFAVRAFSKRIDNSVDRIINYKADKVANAPTTLTDEIYIPVMADTTVGYAGERGSD
jgi:hypothetical protein